VAPQTAGVQAFRAFGAPDAALGVNNPCIISKFLDIVNRPASSPRMFVFGSGSPYRSSPAFSGTVRNSPPFQRREKGSKKIVPLCRRPARSLAERARPARGRDTLLLGLCETTKNGTVAPNSFGQLQAIADEEYFSALICPCRVVLRFMQERTSGRVTTPNFGHIVIRNQPEAS
jgi:hypothetical protein